MAEVVRNINERKAIGMRVLQIHNSRMMAMLSTPGAFERWFGVDEGASSDHSEEVDSRATEVMRRAASRLSNSID